ncbi:MAG: AAA family ATPase, partial [Leptospiraceae bacterium]|nr:AAA family ATPase [Leptospiraceae bacterium]
MSQRKAKLQNLLEKLCEGIFEKEEVIRLTLLASLAGESVFLLGPPGVAKSLIARRLKFAFEDAKFFEYLMNRFSSPEEIFGPISITELQNDNYKRITKGYLPEAHIVFLDEIWKASPAIQNTLLTVLNERIFHNGREVQKVPLRAFIAASNELPAEGEGLEALWDRFLVRYVTKPIENKENFEKMISEEEDLSIDKIPDDYKITEEEYQKWSQEINSIGIPKEVFGVIDVIRKKVELYNSEFLNKNKEAKPIYISDRRWKKIVRLLKTSAYLNERNKVDLMDCFLIQHCIWNEEDQVEKVKEIVWDAIHKFGYSYAPTVDIEKIEEKVKEFNEESNHMLIEEYKENKPVEYEHQAIRGFKFYKLKLEGLGQNATRNPFRQVLYIRKEDYEQIKTKPTVVVYYDLS